MIYVRKDEWTQNYNDKIIAARARVSSAIPGGSALSGWPVERASAGG